MTKFTRNRLPLNLQMFAGEDDKLNENEEVEEKNDNDAFEPIESQSELDSRIGKAVNTALENQKAKHQKELNDAIENALKREKDYSKLTEDERKKQELDDERSAFEKERQEFEFEKLVTDVKDDLIANELPSSFAIYLAVEGDVEKSKENVRIFKEEYNNAVAEGVKKSLRQNDPRYGSNGQAGKKTTNYGAQLAQGLQSNKKPFDI